MTAADVIASIALIAGAAMSLAAGVAVLRFPDTASRIHAATKPQVLGVVLLMIGLGIRLGTVAVIGELVLIVLLQFLTAPVSAHLAVRAAHRRAGAESGAGGGDPGGAGDRDGVWSGGAGEPDGTSPGGDEDPGPDGPSGRRIQRQ